MLEEYNIFDIEIRNQILNNYFYDQYLLFNQKKGLNNQYKKDINYMFNVLRNVYQFKFTKEL